MATAIDYLAVADQPQPKFVAPPNSARAEVIYERVQRMRFSVQRKPSRLAHMQLGTVGNCEFRVIKAIPVHLDVRAGTVIASWRQVDEFGTGPSSSLACADLGHTVVELYEALEADQARLGPDLAEVWKVVQAHVVRRRS